MTDFLNPPYINEINIRDYEGIPVNKIHVSAGDDFGVAGVSVRIFDPSGVEIEKGNCVQNPVTSYYDYIAKVAIAGLAGVEIIAAARDIPSHTGELSVIL